MKIATVLGTRPEIIRLSLLIPKLDRLCDHVLIHTGQNYAPGLSDVFFQQLGVRQPNHYLSVKATAFGEQAGQILQRIEAVLLEERPDRLLILGDTNSGLAAIIAKRMAIPVYHMEAGNRCYDDRVPEEVNRRIIDHSSDVLLPYTERSRQNLLREGIPGDSIYVTGNPIYEVLRYYDAQISASDVVERLGLTAGTFFLVTMHRAENVDIPGRLQCLVSAMVQLHDEYGVPVIVSTHPRTRARLKTAGLEIQRSHIHFLDPFGFFDFITLERNAMCVVTDSGTVQEECAILGVPNVTIRDVTERPETIECGNNMLTEALPKAVCHCVATQLSRSARPSPPREYLVENVSDIVVAIVTGYRRETTSIQSRSTGRGTCE